MPIAIAYGRQHADVDIPDSRSVKVSRQPPAPALPDPGAAVRQALETPLGFPALRRALTPDDHVAILVDEHLPRLSDLLTPILEHVSQAGVAAEAITLLCPPNSARQPWVDDLPDAFQDVRLEVHDPSDRRHLSYLATTRQGRRVYLNRTAVDADQLVVLSRRGYDPLLGYAGAEGAIYPAFSDEATIQEGAAKLSMLPPGKTAWPTRQEAAEVAWLLGAPFMVQVIEGAQSEIVHVLGGLVETSGDGQRLLDARWRIEVAVPADTVIATVSGDPARHTFSDFAQALACASRVVKPEGRIVLLTDAEPALGPGAELLRQAEDPAHVLNHLHERNLVDTEAVFLWASAAKQATIFLLSRLPAETAEALFTVPLQNSGEVQRLVRQGSCLIVPDAHRTIAAIRSNERAASLEPIPRTGSTFD
jgi:nickel-dependent lactate racemase